MSPDKQTPLPRPAHENRRSPRVDFRGEVYLEGDRRLAMQAFNLSECGVGLVCPRAMGLGRGVVVSFLARSMSVKGVVRREIAVTVSLWQIGVEFNQFQPELVAVAAKSAVAV